MKKIFIILIAFIGSIFFMIAQEQSTYYVQITGNFEYKLYENTNKSLQISSNIAHLDNILNRSNIKEFKLAFPDMKGWLREVYTLICDNANLEKELITPQLKSIVPLVEKDVEVPMLAGDMPNDPIYIQGSQTDLALIQASEAWAIAKNYPKVNVAVTDTYFDPTHADLNFTLVGGTNNNNVSSVAHGTFTAGRIAAINNNGIGVASAGGYNTNLYVSTNWGSHDEVRRLAQAGYRVINLSWGSCNSYSTVRNEMYRQIRDDFNTVVVCAAGNGDNQCVGKFYPASYESCLSVTSVGHKNARGTVDADGISRNWEDVHENVIGDSSSTHHHNDAVDICAAGYKVYSTAYADTYYESGGTSFAAPQVAGVAAMILAINPNLTANQVVDILKSTADASIYNIPENTPYIGLLGAGRLDAYAAVQAACATTTVHFTNQIVTNNTEVNTCGDIEVQNANVTNGVKLTLDAGGTTTIESNFEVSVGSELEIK